MAITVQMRTQVSQLYVALFGRAPDGDGLAFWVGRLDTLGGTAAAVTQIANDMFATAPARAYFPLFLTNREIISSFYVNVLGRAADTGGLDFWTAKLDARGATPGSVITEMISAVVSFPSSGSAEGVTSRDLFNNKVTVAQAYGEKNLGVTNATSILSGVTASTATVTSAINLINTNNGAPIGTGGQTFTLTTGLDNRTGGTGSDTFDGSLGGTGGNLQTLGSSDVLDGGLGSDTLIATLTGGTTVPTLTSIETLTVSATGAATLDLLNTTGATTLESSNSTAALTFTNIGSASTALKVTNTNQNATFTYTAAAVAGTADVASLALYNVTGGTVTANGIETLNVTSGGSANTVTLANSALTTLNVSGTQDLTLGTVGSTVTKIDASGLTTGRLSVTAANATAASLTGGGSNDTMTGAAGNDNISGGDGNDSLSGAGGNDVISGGNGNDTINGGANNDNISGGDGNDTLVFADLTELAGDGTVGGGAGTDTLSFTGDIGADVVESTLVNSRVSSIEGIALSGVAAAQRTITLTDAAMTALGTTTFTVTDGQYGATAATGGVDINASALTAANAIDATFNNRSVVTFTVTTAAAAADTVVVAVGGTTYATYTAPAGGDANATASATNIAAAINAVAAGTYVATNAAGVVVLTPATVGTAMGATTATSTGTVRLNLQAGAGAVNATALAMDNSYTGGAGNDTFRVGNVGGGVTANDTLVGGTGTDTLIVTGGTTTATTVDMTNVSGLENITTSGTGLVTVNAFATTSIASTATLTIDATSQTNSARGLNVDASGYTTTGAGKINVTSGAGADTIVGTAGSDTITSGAGNDTVTAGSGNDSVSLGDGDDTAVYASEAAFSDDTGTTLVRDTVDGGAGNDILQFTTAAATLSAAQLAGATGFEIIDLAITGSSVTLTDAVVDANGGDVQQVRVTDAGTVTASALTAPNAVAVRVENAVGSGVVSVTGGAGNDSATFSGATNGVLSATDAVKLGAGTDTIYVTNVAGHAAGTGAASSATLSSLVTGVESLVISDLATDQAAGDVTIALDNSFTATTFTIDGSQLDAGEDLAVTVATNATTASTTTAVSVVGGAGADTLNGDLKADTLIGGDGADVLEGEAGIDSLSGGNGDDVFVVNTLGDFAGLTTVETVSGGAGNDTLRLSATGTYNSSDLLGLSSVETINLNSAGNAVLNLADSVFTANGAATLAVTVSNTAGNSTVNASAVGAANSISVTTNNTAGSDDSLVGGAGNDTFTATIDNAGGDLDAADTITGGAGSDTLVLSIRATGQTATLTNVTGVETIRTAVGTGGAAANTITLGAIADTLVAAGTTLTMNFSDRTGVVTMNATNNEADGTFNITTGTANDVLYGGALADTVDAGAGDDSITAGAGADSIIGNGGNDTLVGGAGADNLTGGSGSDVFVYTAVSESSGANIDTITDFVSADDQVRVTLNYSGVVAGVTVNATRAALGQAGLTDAQAALTGERGQYVYDTTNARLYVNFNADNLITSLDYSIAINAASTAANTIATTDIDFTITGTGQADVITADGGADTINGGAGADSIVGGAGDDVFIVAAAADHAAGETITGGTGSDTIRFTSTTATETLTLTATVTDADNVINVAISDANGVATGTTALNVTAGALAGTLAVNLTGNAGNNTLTGTANADTISGGLGADTITGGAGADTIDVGNDAVADQVVLSSKATVDSISNFHLLTNTTQEDLLVISVGGIALLKAGDAGAATGAVAAANAAAFQSIAAAGAVTTTANNNVFVFNNAVFNSAAAIQAAIRGGANSTVITFANANATGDFLAIYDAGADVRVAVISVAAATTTAAATVTDIAVLVGVADLTGLNTADLAFAA